MPPLLDFTQMQGLTVTGPATATRPNALRRARGLHETCINELRPASGNSSVKAGAGVIHSITRFNDLRFYAVGSALLEVNAGSVLTGLNGSYLTLLRMPPGNTQPDQLFVAGGGLLRKVSTGLTVTQWGIDPPPDGFTATIQAQLVKDIELFEDQSTWTLVGTGAAKSDEATIKEEGSNSLQVDMPANLLATLSKSVTLDLSQFSVAGDSSDEDLIELWVRVDGATGFEYFTLRFDVGAGNFATDFYQYKFLPLTVTQNTRTVEGIGTRDTVATDEAGFVGSSDGGSEAENGVAGDTAAGSTASEPGGSEDGVGLSSNTWTRLRVSKKLFQRTGTNTNTWANVAAIQLMIVTNSTQAITLYFDKCRMIGGAGMLGDYQHLITFDNTTTGARSNSNPAPVRTSQNERQKVAYASLPVSADPQVNARTLWRTLGNGAAFFREHVIEDNSTTSYTSRVADYVGLWSNDASEVLFLPELPTDNIVPDSTHIDALYDQATVFWISGASGKKGRVYYSPAGRPEAQRGFIDVSDDDQPLLRLVVWNRARYVWGEAHPYRIDGVEPYTPYRFDGVPGVLAAQARTVVSTPYGIIWQAKDGLRRFNGSTSDLIFFDRLGPLFRSEGLEGFTSFQGVYAGYARDQYFISDGVQGFALNLATGFIRDLGQGFTALYYEDDTKTLLAGVGNSLVAFEEPGVAPNIPCEWETAALYSPPGITTTCKRIRIDVDTAGQLMTPTIIIDGISQALPPFQLASRGFVEYSIGQIFLSLSVRLNITPTQDFRVYQIYADTYTGNERA